MKKTYILSLEKDDPKKELEFEVAFQLSLTEKQRYKRMKKLFYQAIAERKKKNPSKKPIIISRAF
ncbi:MAG: hypothetical protein R6W90_07835 [Ignavibacteriaceae bacterium]